jgi:hypothetical protein
MYSTAIAKQLIKTVKLSTLTIYILNMYLLSLL